MPLACQIVIDTHDGAIQDWSQLGCQAQSMQFQEQSSPDTRAGERQYTCGNVRYHLNFYLVTHLCKDFSRCVVWTYLPDVRIFEGLEWIFSVCYSQYNIVIFQPFVDRITIFYLLCYTYLSYKISNHSHNLNHHNPTKIFTASISSIDGRFKTKFSSSKESFTLIVVLLFALLPIILHTFTRRGFIFQILEDIIECFEVFPPLPVHPAI